jgi:hypothetical protein
LLLHHNCLLSAAFSAVRAAPAVAVTRTKAARQAGTRARVQLNAWHGSLLLLPPLMGLCRFLLLLLVHTALLLLLLPHSR